MSESADDDDAPLMIGCAKHGTCVSAVVCCHMLKPAWKKVGFVENSEDPHDLQAWCEKCEQLYLQEGDKTERFVAFNSFKLVCTCCYTEIKKRHSR